MNVTAGSGMNIEPAVLEMPGDRLKDRCRLCFVRFKHHLFDLTFVEKSSRWVTNTQVKIKTEVSMGSYG